jgi:hypothetical protein
MTTAERKTRQELLHKFANAMVSNWIATGDKVEAQRAQAERVVRGVYRHTSIGDLTLYLENTTRR